MTKLHPDFAEFIINYAKKKEAERKAKEPAVLFDLRNGGNLPKRPTCYLCFALLATVFWLALMGLGVFLMKGY